MIFLLVNKYEAWFVTKYIIWTIFCVCENELIFLSNDDNQIKYYNQVCEKKNIIIKVDLTGDRIEFWQLTSQTKLYINIYR